MTTPRQEFLTAKFNDWLDRFAAPRRIANNTAAQQQDANSMLETVMRFAPREEYGDWLVSMLRRLEDGMTTRSWPAPGEVVKACKVGAAGISGMSDEIKESLAVDRMESWYRTFHDQMPGSGKASRTAELIRRGVLKDLREARYRGFDLDAWQTKTALEQQAGADEDKHHRMILEDLQVVTARNAERREEIARGRALMAGEAP